MKKTAKKYFIPHEGNEYKPHFFREKSVVALSLIIALLFIFSIFQGSFIKKGNFAAVISSVLVDLTNDSRQANDISALSVSPILTEAAQKKADDMAENGYFAHESPDGILPWHWFKEAGYRFLYAGENLAINFSDSEKVEEAWMNSPGHRDNILNSKFTEIGIATSRGTYEGRDTVFVVQMFGRPAPAVKTAPVFVNDVPEATAVGETEKVGTKEEEEVEIVANEGEFVAVKSVDYASFAEELVASPNKTLFYFYLIIGAIVSFGLILFVFVEIKRQHPKNIIYALFLVAFMAGLFYVNHSFVFSDILVK